MGKKVKIGCIKKEIYNNSDEASKIKIQKNSKKSNLLVFSLRIMLSQ